MKSNYARVHIFNNRLRESMHECTTQVALIVHFTTMAGSSTIMYTDSADTTTITFEVHLSPRTAPVSIVCSPAVPMLATEIPYTPSMPQICDARDLYLNLFRTVLEQRGLGYVGDFRATARDEERTLEELIVVVDFRPSATGCWFGSFEASQMRPAAERIAQILRLPSSSLHPDLGRNDDVPIR